MRLSTNRVNFTNSYVAQFNYVKFLCKYQSKRKGIQDIVTILGLHSDEIASYDIQSVKTDDCCVKLQWSQNSLVLCVSKKLCIYFERTMQWYVVVLNMHGKSMKMIFEYDLKSREVRTKLLNMRCFSNITIYRNKRVYFDIITSRRPRKFFGILTLL